MKLRLYLDEDTMRSDLLQALRARGIDVTSVQEAGMRGRADDEQLRYASEQGRVLYSFNRKDYLLLHTNFLEHGLSHAGILLEVHNRWSVGEQMRRLLRVIDSISAEDMRDRVEFLSAWA